MRSTTVQNTATHHPRRGQQNRLTLTISFEQLKKKTTAKLTSFSLSVDVAEPHVNKVLPHINLSSASIDFYATKINVFFFVRSAMIIHNRPACNRWPIITARVRTYDGRLCFHRCVSVQGRGVPGPGRGGSQVQVQVGGSQVQVGGVPCLGGSQFWGGSQFQGGYPVSGQGRYPVSVKGKFFDTRFGLIHVQPGKKIFVERLPPPSKGKNF